MSPSVHSLPVRAWWSCGSARLRRWRGWAGLERARPGVAIRRIGLTGGIGSGKSTVAAIWVAKGARSLTEAGGAAMPAVRLEFGNQFVDAHGALDRQRMRELAFADPSAKRRLEAILHPLIGHEAMAQAARSPNRVIVHGRTPYQDAVAAEDRRHLVRLWLRAGDRRQFRG